MVKNGLLVLMAVFLVACGASQFTFEDLGKTEWKLVSLDNRDPVAGARVTLNIFEDSINGTTGCNVYNARYKLSGDRISILDMSMTKQYCEDPPGIMEQERIYMDILGNVVRVLVEDGQLRLLTEDEQFLLFGESLDRSTGE